MSDNHSFDDDDDFFEDDYVPTINRWKLLGAALAIVIITGFGIGIWYAYDQGVKQGVQLAPPIIKADDTPVKEQPEDPGGMEIPHQDKKVFNVLNGEENTEEKVEKLMEPPEEVVEEDAPVDIKEDPAAKKPAEKETLMAKDDAVEATEETAETAPSEGVAGTEAASESKPLEKMAEKPGEETAEVAKDVADAEEKVTEAVEAESEEETAPPAPEKVPAVDAGKKPEVAAKEAPAGIAFRVQLGAFRSEDAAKKAWRDLQKKHEELLSGEVYKIQSAEVTGKGLFFRLQAGAFDDRSQAADLCNQLKARKQDCLIAKN